MIEDPKEIEKELHRQYLLRKQRIQESEEYGKWKGMTKAQRKYIGAAIVLALIVLLVLIYCYWGVTPTYPSGEGG